MLKKQKQQKDFYDKKDACGISHRFHYFDGMYAKYDPVERKNLIRRPERMHEPFFLCDSSGMVKVVSVFYAKPHNPTPPKKWYRNNG